MVVDVWVGLLRLHSAACCALHFALLSTPPCLGRMCMLPLPLRSLLQSSSGPVWASLLDVCKPIHTSTIPLPRAICSHRAVQCGSLLSCTPLQS